MSRADKRKVQRDIAHIVEDAKKDMAGWIIKLPYNVTEKELIAWKAGYIAGINAANRPRLQ